MAKTAKDSATGISIRFVESYDVQADTNPLRIDAWKCEHCGEIIWTSNYIGHMAAHLVKSPDGEIQ